MLYLIATPIGNLGDMTVRAIETLKSVDMIASEDTRTTSILLKHFEIRKPQISFHDHNERHAAERVIGMLKVGQSVAIVSDAGTPGISDPGFAIVRRAIEEDLPFTMVPGPAAFVMALVLSGLATHSFTFRGFPPRKGGPRRRFIGVDKNAPHTLIYYESVHRIGAFLDDALAVLGDRPAALASELTKKFESIDRGPLSALIERLPEKPKGEYVVVIAGSDGKPAPADDEADDTE
ncbi:MAG: 16S rRNA (cytidine(1402)-2'-O)-methyltransferase [Roseiflexaceae bacterium]|nr:16S rRNA (cytidine(1402)-2'-O)-methyltransferase [Roseiflexaceae bacterium]